MISTGKIYGLDINSLIDERRDPIKSTDAASRYLKDLYDTYEDWNLAIAAYNCGGGNVNKAIKRAGGKKDYWAIYPYLPRETRSYVPFFIAANYVMNYYACHQLSPVQTSLPLSTDTVMVSQMIHFDQIADILKIDKEMLRALNPQYKRDIIPGNYHPQILKLPAIQAYAFVEKENEIAAYRADELFTNRTYVQGSTASNHREKIFHRVTPGETILTIGNKYGISAKNIRRWNGLRSNSVHVGSRLTLYVDNGGYTTVRNADAKTPSDSVSTTSVENSSTAGADSSSATTVYYKVRQGDSYSSIAQKFPGCSATDLMKLNNITHSALKVGQYILVPKI
jgi:membrane-bound lytic murein transglycosylase D